MQKPAQLIQNNLARLNKPCPQISNGQNNDENKIVDTRIEKLFLELAGIYGYLLKSMHKTVTEWAAAKHRWHKKLFQEFNFNCDEIEFAIDESQRLRTQDGQVRIPTLPEFTDFAKQRRKRNNELAELANRDKIIKIAKKPTDLEVEAAKKEWQKFLKRKTVNQNA